MTPTPKFFFFLFTAMIMSFHCMADQCPPPINLTYKWLDNFTVNVSWIKPRLSDKSRVSFLISNQEKKTHEVLKQSYTTFRYLTKMGSDGFTCNISTLCNLNQSTPASIVIETPKPPAEVVEDFKCLFSTKEMNCSWNPISQFPHVTVYYRICGDSKGQINSLKKCDQPYTSGKRNGCFLNVTENWEDTCIHVDTETAMSTFQAELVVPPPKLSIKEDGPFLKVNWTPTKIRNCKFIYKICVKQCGGPEECWGKPGGEPMMEVPYKNHCLYEFKSKVQSTETCPNISSDYSESVTYGTDDRTLTVVAIVIPIILSLCVILSCYCFRRHSSIICPIIPDPSAIFKEMMMNGNKEHMTTTGSLYAPVPEPIEPCKITLVIESDVPQQNS